MSQNSLDHKSLILLALSDCVRQLTPLLYREDADYIESTCDPDVIRLCEVLEDILCDGSRTHDCGDIPVWQMIEKYRPLVKICKPFQVVYDAVASPPHVKSPILYHPVAKARAWVRAALNHCAMADLIQCMLNEHMLHTTDSILSHYYSPTSILCDPRDSQILVGAKLDILMYNIKYNIMLYI